MDAFGKDTSSRILSVTWKTGLSLEIPSKMGTLLETGTAVVLITDDTCPANLHRPPSRTMEEDSASPTQSTSPSRITTYKNKYAGLLLNRRKKKCFRYMEGSKNGMENPNSVASSLDEANTPDSNKTDNSISGSMSASGSGSMSDLKGHRSILSPAMSMSSPQSLPLTSPMMLPSPSLSLMSPMTPNSALSRVSSATDNASLCAFSPTPLLSLPGMPVQQRGRVGTNPHDINNPLSVNQLTGLCQPKAKPHSLTKPVEDTGPSIVSVNT
ncbi:unnamed protein product [Notodromas monacha]|uniref:Uncharacterized protein n=1 Tax=Notodromas monacha TaxID=399045 RepID=A0A7R9BSH3_9CRUS|nr:unnamed protein product [Notodromas monacha]CAG0920887.1 unnamed protein product [Notodromas monacha]